MGVKTKIWGPLAWIFIHGFCKFVDGLKDKAVHQAAIEVLAQLPSVTPCIFCRNSMNTFFSGALNPLTQKPRTLAKWAYNLHEIVNRKLFCQTVENADDDLVYSYWLGYSPKFEDVLYYLPDSSLSWWYAMFGFCTYMVCDYEEERGGDIRQFIKQLSDVFAIINPASSTDMMRMFVHIAQGTPLPLDFDANLLSRIEYVHTVQLDLFSCGGFWVPSLADCFQQCSEAIVGCSGRELGQYGC